MLSRVFLAAGVAALAIAAPTSAKPGGNGGGHGNGGPPAAHGAGGGQDHGKGGGGGGGGGPAFAGGGGGGHGNRGGGGGPGGGAPAFNGGGHGGGQAIFMGGGGHGGGGSARPQQRVERQQARPQIRQQARSFERKQAKSIQHQQSRGFERQEAKALQRQQSRSFERQQAKSIQRQQSRGFEHQQAKATQPQQVRTDQQFQQQAFANEQVAFQNGKGAKFKDRQLAQGLVAAAPAYQTLTYGNGVPVLPMTQVQQFIGVPVAQVTNFVGLSALPASIQYLYPATPDYYYQYGDGYLYQIDRGDNLISALIPLLAGGFLPGQYLPQPYMASYVPDYYGLNSFYPDYEDVCNRYYYGVVYQVDCDDGYVENVIPMYAGGYGVGQLLPSAYTYYNVPTQYRSVYYDTSDYGYWYSPGAIYQYDPRSSMITSVAALLSPGFTVGQQLPMGYDVYNVPYAYRATYYDTPNAWYRYSNGYIYQVDPMTQIVTAIVASLLT